MIAALEAYGALALIAAACVVSYRARYYRRVERDQERRSIAMQPAIDAALAERRTRPVTEPRPAIRGTGTGVLDLTRAAS